MNHLYWGKNNFVPSAKVERIIRFMLFIMLFYAVKTTVNLHVGKKVQQENKAI